MTSEMALRLVVVGESRLFLAYQPDICQEHFDLMISRAADGVMTTFGAHRGPRMCQPGIFYEAGKM